MRTHSLGGTLAKIIRACWHSWVPASTRKFLRTCSRVNYSPTWDTLWVMAKSCPEANKLTDLPDSHHQRAGPCVSGTDRVL